MQLRLFVASYEFYYELADCPPAIAVMVVGHKWRCGPKYGRRARSAVDLGRSSLCTRAASAPFPFTPVPWPAAIVHGGHLFWVPNRGSTWHVRPGGVVCWGGGPNGRICGTGRRRSSSCALYVLLVCVWLWVAVRGQPAAACSVFQVLDDSPDSRVP